MRIVISAGRMEPRSSQAEAPWSPDNDRGFLTVGVTWMAPGLAGHIDCIDKAPSFTPSVFTTGSPAGFGFERFHRRVQTLPAETFEVSEGLTLTQIFEQMKRTKDAFVSRLKRAMGELRQRIARSYGKRNARSDPPAAAGGH